MTRPSKRNATATTLQAQLNEAFGRTPEAAEVTLKVQLDEAFGRTSAGKPGKKTALLGNFGVAEKPNEPHFLVDVGARVLIWEVRQAVDDTLVRQLRAELNAAQWAAIVPTLEHEFNRELAKDGLRRGRFRKVGETRLSLSNLGKEMLVLVWAIENLAETDLSTVRGAWLNLHRIERWWLFNMTVTMNGHISSRGHGWRAALMHALSARPAADHLRTERVA